MKTKRPIAQGDDVFVHYTGRQLRDQTYVELRLDER